MPLEQGPQTEADAVATAVLSAVNEDADSPACLATVPASMQSNSSSKKKPTNLLTVESELELPGSLKTIKQCTTKSVTEKSPKRDRQNNNNDRSRAASIEELEFGDDVSAGLSLEADGDELPQPTGVLDAAAIESRQLTRVHGAEELPAAQQSPDDGQESKIMRGKLGLPVLSKAASAPVADDRNGNDNDQKSNRNYSTLPKVKKHTTKPSSVKQPSAEISNFANVTLVSVTHPNGSGVRRKVPMRTTPDGTNIYYWCDMSKRPLKG